MDVRYLGKLWWANITLELSAALPFSKPLENGFEKVNMYQMSKYHLILREHEAGRDGAKTHTLKLSSTAEETTYAIILKTSQSNTEQTLLVTDGYSSDPDCQALLHSQYGYVCFEALKSDLAVQSYMQVFTGINSNGHMPLRQSSAEHRVLFQLHPRESLFIGSKTISVMPCECTEAQMASSEREPHEAIIDPPNDSEATQMLSETAAVTQAEHRRPTELSHHDFDDYVNTTADSPTELAISQSSQLHSENTAKLELFQPQMEDVAFPDNHESDLDGFTKTLPKSLKRKAWVPNDCPADLQDNKGSRGSPASSEADHSGSHLGRVELSFGNTSFADAPTLSLESSNSPLLQHGSSRSQAELNSEVGYAIPEKYLPKLSNDFFHQETANGKRQKLEELPGEYSPSPAVEETQDSMMSSIAVQDTGAIPGTIDKDKRDISEEGMALIIDAPMVFEDEVQSSAASSTQKPTSSLRSTRSTAKKTKARASQANDCLRVLFASSTSIDSSKQFMRFLESRGVRRASSVDDCTHLCVSKSDGLKKTGKFVMAVLLGRQVIWYDWVTESIKARTILNPDHFAARSPDREIEWGVNLNEAIERGRKNEQGPFSGWSFVFTPAAKNQAGKSGYSELTRIISLAGGRKCSTVLPKNAPGVEDLTLVIAIQEDPALEKLRENWRCFSRDVIALSAMRGRLDISSDEFLITDDSPSRIDKI